MNSPPKIKNPAPVADADHGGVFQASLKAEHEAAARMSWSIPPDDRDGLEIHIGYKGHVVLSQQRTFEEKSEIILHPVEARALRKILPLAIDAAKNVRGEAK